MTARLRNALSALLRAAKDGNSAAERYCGHWVVRGEALEKARAALEADNRAGAYRRAVEIRAAQGWKIDHGPVPVLYTDTINGHGVLRDDVWLCKTEHLRETSTVQALGNAPHGSVS